MARRQKGDGETVLVTGARGGIRLEQAPARFAGSITFKVIDATAAASWLRLGRPG